MQRFIVIFQPLLKKYGITRSSLFLVVAFCILAASLVYFSLSFGKPFMGVDLSLLNNEWIVQNVDPNGSAGQAGIQPGDEPVVINGEAARQFLDKYTEFGVASGLLIKDIEVIDHNGQKISASLEGSTPSRDSFIEFSSLFLLSLIFWVTGFYTFFKRPENRAALIFCLSGLAVGLLVSTTIARDCLIPGSYWIAAICTALGPWMLLHFFLVLPEERKWIQGKRPVYLLYMIPVLTLLSKIKTKPYFRQV